MKLVQHHVKYKEIHGVDEVVLMSQSEHKKLHLRLRKEGKCNISTEELHAISNRAHYRTPSGRKALNKNVKEHYKKNPAKHQAKAPRNLFFFDFSDTIAPYAQLFERIRYNPDTDHVSCVTYFHFTYYKKVQHHNGDRSLSGVSHEVLPEYKQGDRPLIERSDKE